MIRKTLAILLLIGLLALPNVVGCSSGPEFPDGIFGTVFEDANANVILKNLEKNELQAFLVIAIDRLTEQEKLVIALYYYEELTLKEVGAVLGVTESRISQIHSAAMKRLRHFVREHEGER